MILDVFPKTENVTDLGTYFHVRKNSYYHNTQCKYLHYGTSYSSYSMSNDCVILDNHNQVLLKTLPDVENSNASYIDVSNIMCACAIINIIGL